MLYLGKAPQRWTRYHPFPPPRLLSKPAYDTYLLWPLTQWCEPFRRVFLCQEYWTILDPLRPSEASYPALETQLHRALRESFTHRGLPPPILPPYKRVVRIGVQNDAPLPAWSCGTVGMSTILHLLLGDKHAHEMPLGCITHGHMLALHEALLKRLLTGTPHPSEKAAV